MASGTGERRAAVTFDVTRGVKRGETTKVASKPSGSLGDALDEAFEIVTADEHQFELPTRTRGERAASPPTAEVDVATGGPAVLLGTRLHVPSLMLVQLGLLLLLPVLAGGIPTDGGTLAGGGWFWSPGRRRWTNRPRDP
jgi:hypothetical protein